MLTSMREGNATGLVGMPRRPQQENDAIPKIAPKWLKHDRQVSFSNPSVTAAGSNLIIIATPVTFK